MILPDRAQALIEENPAAASAPQVMLMNATNEDALDFFEAQFFQNRTYLMPLRAAPYLDRLRNEPRFIALLEHLDSMETHTEAYLRDHDIKTGVQL